MPGTGWVLNKHHFLPLCSKKLIKHWHPNGLSLVRILFSVLADSCMLGSGLLPFLRSGSYSTPQR